MCPVEENILQKGNQETEHPVVFTIINNLTLERPSAPINQRFEADLPMTSNENRQMFDDSAQFVINSLFGRLPRQTEKLLSDSPFGTDVCISQLYAYEEDVPSIRTSFVSEDRELGSEIIIADRNRTMAYIDSLHLRHRPDIIFIVSNSGTHARASAWAATDDSSRGGVQYTYDGQKFTHTFFDLIPGMSAIHTTSSVLTAAHEFGHAFSSYGGPGLVTDLYVDGNKQFNRKVGRPIAAQFAIYNGSVYDSDQSRDGIGYPKNWKSYHPKLRDVIRPALMDNYYLAGNDAMLCLHDDLTKQYILDRLSAKTSRR